MIIQSKYLFINQDNISTDSIFPSEYLNRIDVSDYSKYLFNEDDKIKSLLKESETQNCQIFVSKKNFGFGSSREQAVWALQDFGIKAIIAISFNPVFVRNAINNGLLPISISNVELNKLTSNQNDPISSNYIQINIKQGKLREIASNFKTNFSNDYLNYFEIMSIFDSAEYHNQNAKNIEKHIAVTAAHSACRR